MNGIESYVVAVETVTVVAGGFVTLLAARAYRRTGSRALRALAVGLGLVVCGGLLGGLFHQLVGTDLAVGAAVRGTFTAAGFLTMAYSLYAGGRSRRAYSPDPG